jgi:HTH-like domain
VSAADDAIRGFGLHLRERPFGSLIENFVFRRPLKKGYSQRRACALIGIAPKTYRYVTSRGDDSEFRERLRRLAAERRRFGYRRLHILLRREGLELNHKKLLRIYRQERLTVRRRGGRKLAWARERQ